MTQPQEQVSIYIQYYGLDSIYQQCGNQLLSLGADNVLNIYPMDVRNTEQRDLGPGASESLYPISWSG